MSRSNKKNKLGQEFSDKFFKSQKPKNKKKKSYKYMGNTSGDQKSADAKKGVTYIKYGYPGDFRRKPEIQEKIDEKLTVELISEGINIQNQII